jgi:hypothetical protein
MCSQYIAESKLGLNAGIHAHLVFLEFPHMELL